MALNKDQLKNEIKAVYDEVFTKKLSPEESIEFLSDGIATAIDNYTRQAQVIVNSRIPVQVVPNTGTGETTANGTGILQ